MCWMVGRTYDEAFGWLVLGGGVLLLEVLAEFALGGCALGGVLVDAALSGGGARIAVRCCWLVTGAGTARRRWLPAEALSRTGARRPARATTSPTIASPTIANSTPLALELARTRQTRPHPAVPSHQLQP
jgi:hypothetical protein